MSGKTYTEDDLANLSDEEMMGIAIPPTMAEEDPGQGEEDDTGQNPTGEETGAAAEADEDDGAASGSQAADTSDADDDDAPGKPADGDAGGDGSAPAGPATTAPAAEDKSKSKAEPADKAAKPGEEQKPQGPSDEELRALYSAVMGTFKANGKEIKLQSPDEAVRLMQMGANYTKKLQALQPQLKLLKMLENNGLLDEGKLTYLIDLDKKNPDAIKKLVKESGVDPLEIDTAAEPAYKPGNHKVSDAEMAFQTTLDELMLDPDGQKTIVTVNKTWDAKSKELLYQEPLLLQAIHQQRQNGIYDKISNEIERRKMLGMLPANVSFIQTYRAVGDEMNARGLLAPQSAAAPQPSRVVDTRPVTRTKPVTNDEKARAASPVTSSPKKVAQDFNPLALSDEEFEKTAALASRL